LSYAAAPIVVAGTVVRHLGLGSIELNLASNVIALIEDDPLLRVPIAKALEDAGYKVASAASGSEGLAMLQDPRFDLAVIDIFLPGHLDGVLLAQEARKQNPNLRILFTSGKPIAEGRGASALGPFLQKPYRVGELLAAVGRLVGRPRNESS
jgi:DNA-binding response OmpR family regulator